MTMDDDADDDVAGGGPPLPPEDRLWRHPSELSSWGPGGPRRPPAPPARPVARGASWPIAVVAALVGAALCGGILALTGTLEGASRDRVVEKVSMTPVVSSPVVARGDGVPALATKVAPAVARLIITTAGGTNTASAVVFRDDGLLFTSAHEVASATGISVLLHDGRQVDGELVGFDLPTDVAVVSVDLDHLEVAIMGSSDDLEVGASAVALGSPGRAGGTPSVTAGVVSAVDRRLDVGDESLHGLIQTDAAIESAWSGGPLVDASGAVIGITTDLAGDGARFGFATPIDLVRQIADELLVSGKVVHGWLGIEGADLAASRADAMGVRGGATVRRIVPGSPADAAGLAADDVVTEVDGRPITSSSGLVVVLRRHVPGDQLVLGYWRKGDHHEATVTVAEHP